MSRALWPRTCLVIALLSLTPAVIAQSAQPNAVQQADREQKGLQLLRDAVAQSQSFTVPINRLFVESTAAELLWTRDEPLARSFLASVQQRLHELAAQPSGDRSQDEMRRRAFEVRHTLAITIAQSDPALALDFIRNTAPPAGLMFGASQEADLELNLASAAARKSPTVAADLVRQNFTSANPMMLASTIEQISRQDQQTGALLGSEMVNKLASANFASDPKALTTATQLLEFYSNRQSRFRARTVVRGDVMTVTQPGGGVRNAAAQTPAISDAALQRLAQALITASQKPDFPADRLTAIQSAMPAIQKFLPSATLKNKTGDALPPAASRTDFWNQFNEVQQKGSMEDALAFVANAPDGMRYGAYQQLAMHAATNGNLDEAREVLSQADIPDFERQQMLENAARMAASSDAAKGALEQARAAAESIRYPSERAQAYVQMAHAALSRKDTVTAKALLEEARSLLPATPADASQMNAFGQIAAAYARVDPEISAELFGRMISIVNEKLPALQALDGFVYGDHSFVNGEMLLMYSGADQLMSSFALDQLAQADPDRAIQLANQLQRPEAKTKAYLQLARVLLGSRPQRGFVRAGGMGGAVGFIMH